MAGSALGRQQTEHFWFNSERAGLSSSQIDSLRRVLTDATQSGLDESKVNYVTAQIALEEGDLKNSARAIAKALQQNPENISYLEQQLESGFANELIALRSTYTRRTVKKILSLDSLNALAHYHAGQFAMKEWAEFREGLSYKAELGVDIRDPFDIDRIEATGGFIVPVHTESVSRREEAVEHYWAALASSPRDKRTALDLATLFIVDNDLDGLERLVNWWQDYSVEDEYAQFVEGYLYHRQSEFDLAADYFEQALELIPADLRRVYSDPGLVERVTEDARKEESFQAFWSSKDVRMLTEENERWLEHISRIVYSELAFKDWSSGGSGLHTERGNMYVRYGVPEKEFHLFQNIYLEASANEQAKVNAFHVFQYDTGRFVFIRTPMSLANDLILYSPPATFYSSGASTGTDLDFVISTREKIREKPESHDFASNSTRVQFPYFVSRFRSETNPDEVDLLVSLGIPVAGKPESGNLRNQLESGAFLIDNITGVVHQTKESVSELNGSSIRKLKEGTIWTKTLQLTTKPGDFDLSVEFESFGAMSYIGLHRAPLPVVAFDNNTIQLSDLVLASNVEEVEDQTNSYGFTRNGFQITPVSIGVFGQNEPVYLYFEAYGLSTRNNNAEYQIQVELTENVDRGILGSLFSRFRGDKNIPGSIAFSGNTSSSTLGQYLILDITETPPGTYVIALKITDTRSKKSAISSRTVIVE